MKCRYYLREAILKNTIHERETTMKKWKKAILTVLCLGVILSSVACTDMGNTDDDGNKTPTEQNNTNNDVTDGKDKNHQNGGVIDDVGDAVGDGVNDLGNGIKDVTDDMTGNNR